MEDAVSPNNLEPWLRQTLRAQITTAEKAIQKIKADVDAQVTSLQEIVKDLQEKSERDSAEKRNDRAAYKAARAVGRMCEELHGLLSDAVITNPTSYEGLKQFGEGASKLATDTARIRDSWIRHIRPYYILDMMSLNAAVEKFCRLGDQAWNIFSKEGHLLRSLEEARTKAQKIEDLNISLHGAIDERDQVTDEIKKLGPQIQEAERLIESLSVDPKIAGLKKIDSRLRELRGELLASGFRRLGRPLRKLEAMAGRGEYPLVSETRESLSAYLKRPFTTFISEGEGYPGLKAILRSLRDALQRKKLVLKHREERKVLERINNVTEKDALLRIHHEATALVAERRRYLQDPECLQVVHSYKSNKRNLKDLQSKHADLENRSKQVSDKVDSLKGSLIQLGKETGLFAERLTKRRVKVELGLPTRGS